MQLSDSEHRELAEILSKPLSYYSRLQRIGQWIAAGSLVCNIVIIVTLYGYPDLLASKVLPYCLLLAVAVTGVGMFTIFTDRKIIRFLFFLASQTSEFCESEDDADPAS